jgi:predicted outer membrane repeat protein
MKKQPLSVAIFLSFALLPRGEIWGAPLCQHCVSNATELQAALFTADSNTCSDLVKVVQGTYSGHFYFSSNESYSIELRGGYTSGCSSRVINPANTVLSGDGANTVLSINNSNRGDVKIDGFTVQNGNSGSYGGGIYARSQSVNSNADDVTIINSIVRSNRASSSGGGIYAESDGDTGSGTVTISSNTVTGNTASTFGGGVYASSSSNSGSVGDITISSNTISENTGGTDPGGGIHAYSYSMNGASGSISVTSNTIADNVSSDWGGGISANSTGFTGSGSLTLQSNRITGNSGTSGGGARASSYSASGTAGAITFTNNIIQDNSAGGAAGIHVGSTAPSGNAGAITLVNNLIAENTATSTSYGGLYAVSSTTSGTSGAITLTNNTIAGNTAATGDGGVNLRSSTNNAYVYNNIIRGNSTSYDIDLRVDAAYGYNNNYHSLYGIWNGGSGGNIDSDPLFIGGGVYHLSSLSLCIDTGLNAAPSIPATDIGGNNRTIDGDNDLISTVDMGAYEFSPLTYPVKISRTAAYFTTLPLAYTAAEDDDIILASEGTYAGPITFGDGISVKLSGGYNYDFSTVTGSSTITSGLTIGSGTVTIENIIIM